MMKSLNISLFKSHICFRAVCYYQLSGAEAAGEVGLLGGFKEGVCPFCHSPSGFHQELAGLDSQCFLQGYNFFPFSSSMFQRL